MSEYIHSSKRLDSALVLVNMKIIRSNILLAHFALPTIDMSKPAEISSINDILLYEARVAKQYWKYIAQCVPQWTGFSGREAHGGDMVNKLLDIGYHHLSRLVNKRIVHHDISTALGIIHTPHTSDATPLVYDLMELFRADIVDMTVLTWLHQKKRPINRLTQKHIGHFVHDINKRMKKRYYLRDFKQCHTYEYYMELQLLKFIYAVNHKCIFRPLYLLSRHDMRCACKKG